MPTKKLALILAALAAVIAFYLLYFKWGLSGTVAVIEVKGYILTGSDADYYTRIFQRVYFNDSVKAVVVVVDSFGGSANYIEQVYYGLKQLKQKKPVVALAVNALSGGYYVCAAADYIFAHPTSLIGSIGVISTAPPLLIPSESVLETGAYKHTGFSRLGFFNDLNRALTSFLAAVEEGRGSKLKASREELSKARVYLGREALDLGLVDQLGSLQQAVEEAARRAGLVSYTVERLGSEGGLAGPSTYSWHNVTLDLLETLQPPPAVYYIYFPASQLSAATEAQQPPINVSGGRVVIDLSHSNMVSWWDLDALLAKLAELNFTASFVDSWARVERELANATSLIIAAPTKPYGEEEVRRVADFTARGGMLLLLFDPSYEYLGSEGLRNFVVAPINTLSSKFGITFTYGYLYNDKEYYGIYRNIYVRDFANVSIFRNVKTLVLFTASAVRTSHAAAWTSNTTFLMSAEKPGTYGVVAYLRWGNGTVVALGDITIFSEPYCHVEDNYVFISNLAELIAQASPAKGRAEQKLEKPNLPVGTVKVFEAGEDGFTYEVRWVRASEDEVRVETPYGTTRYFYAEGRLKGWASEEADCTYDEPLPEPPFPLTLGSNWSYSVGFTLRARGDVYRGVLEGSEQVEGFEVVRALNEREYFCARIKLILRERLLAPGVTIVTSTRGYYWLSSEAGTVKQEVNVSRLYGGEEAGSVLRRMILKRIEVPQS